MRTVNLIKGLEYNHKNKLVKIDNGNKIYDGDDYRFNTIDLCKTVYKADELVNMNTTAEKIVEDVTKSFIDTFKSRGGATEEQISFAKQTAQVVFGDLKEDIVSIIPAPCGYGKSSISLEILKKLIQMHKTKKTTEGLILVTDRLDSLRKTQDELKSLGLDGYTYLLESWNEDICLNKRIKSSDAKMCTPVTCPHFYDCKIGKQGNEQKKYPILLITNARLRENGASIKQFAYWNQNIKDKDEKMSTNMPYGKRTILLIDERPDVLDTVKVNKKLLNEISTAISNCEYTDADEKTSFENMFAGIANTIISDMQKFRKKYKRFIVSNNSNKRICKTDDDFMFLWDKYMKGSYKRELEHIHTVLTKGGFYVYEKNTEFITTIGSKDIRDMYSDTYKTIIFDGTALYDPLYLGMYEKQSIKYLDVENTREYNNLTINAYLQNKLTKTTFKDKKYLTLACGKFVNQRMKYGINKAYIVTYQTVASPINDCINKFYDVVRSNGEIFYFGNTKGKNDMQNCNLMFQFGWDTLPDYEYVIQWFSVTRDWNLLLHNLETAEKAEKMSEELIVKDRSQTLYNGDTYETCGYKCYEFGIPSLNQFKLFSIVTNFYQEAHRTKLRNYSCNNKIEINVFSIKTIILGMIEQLFNKCTLNKINEDLGCFRECKISSRKSKDGETIPQKILNWINEWDGQEIKTKDMLETIGITQKQFSKAKENNTSLKEILNKISIGKGVYKKVS